MNEEEVKLYKLPLYQSHKRVRAVKIGKVGVDHADGSAVITPEDDKIPPFRTRERWADRYQGDDHDLGYFVAYEDGFSSWSPTSVFEAGHTLI